VYTSIQDYEPAHIIVVDDSNPDRSAHPIHYIPSEQQQVYILVIVSSDFNMNACGFLCTYVDCGTS